MYLSALHSNPSNCSSNTSAQNSLLEESIAFGCILDPFFIFGAVLNLKFLRLPFLLGTQAYGVEEGAWVQLLAQRLLAEIHHRWVFYYAKPSQ